MRLLLKRQSLDEAMAYCQQMRLAAVKHLRDSNQEGP